MMKRESDRDAKCHRCGFIAPRGEFVSWQGNGDQDWLMFHCPQCSSEPALTDADAPPNTIPKGFLKFRWEVTISDAMRLEVIHPKGGRSCNYIHPDHPFLQKDGMKELAAQTKADHDARSERFKAGYEAIKVNGRPGDLSGKEKAQYTAKIDALREECQLGTHEPRTVIAKGGAAC